MKAKQIEIFLDSGAWSAYTQKKPIDIDKYIAYIKEHKDLIDVYVNLDVIGDASASLVNFLYMRDQGLNPLPVYHAESNVKALYRYLKYTDYIAIGAIANMSTRRRLVNLNKLWEEHLTDNKGMPIAKFHGFGLTGLEILYRYPWWSVDSTSWVMYGRYGGVLVPRFKNNHYVYNENIWKVFVSSRSPAQKIEGKHFLTYTRIEQNQILDYFQMKGFELGKSEIIKGEKKEKIIQEGLCNNHNLRDHLNQIYFADLEKAIPEWPWLYRDTEGSIL